MTNRYLEIAKNMVVSNPSCSTANATIAAVEELQEIKSILSKLADDLEWLTSQQEVRWTSGIHVSQQEESGLVTEPTNEEKGFIESH